MPIQWELAENVLLTYQLYGIIALTIATEIIIILALFIIHLIVKLFK